jgi:hypothetical protein
VSAPERGVAVDGAAVLTITGDVIGRHSGSIPVSATVQVLRDVPLRVVARYEVALADGTTALVVGKWYAGDRGISRVSASRSLPCLATGPPCVCC